MSIRYNRLKISDVGYSPEPHHNVYPQSDVLITFNNDIFIAVRTAMFVFDPGGGGGRLLVNRVPMREQRTAKLTLNGVFDILKLIPLFTLSSQKVTLSNVVN